MAARLVVNDAIENTFFALAGLRKLDLTSMPRSPILFLQQLSPTASDHENENAPASFITAISRLFAEQ